MFLFIISLHLYFVVSAIPLLFLAVAAIINIILDLVFIVSIFVYVFAKTLMLLFVDVQEV